ncbi:MAG: glycosyltransferase [Verrucomicrobiota bacterium]
MLTVSVAIYKCNIDMFENMIRSVAKHTPQMTRFILIDNGLCDIETIEHLIRQNVQCKYYIHNSNENLGFGAAHNISYELCDTKYLAVINDDVEFYESWATKMIAQLVSGDYIICGITGTPNKLNEVFASEVVSDYKDANYVEGSCFIINHEKMTSIRNYLFDPNFIIGYFEDTDLGYFLTEEGYELTYVDVDWKHFGGQTSSKDDKWWYVQKNSAYFRRKWSTKFI